MTTTELTRKEQRRKDLERATFVMDRTRESIAAGCPVLIVPEYGSGQTDYFRVSIVTTGERPVVLSLTWAIGQLYGYALRDKGNGWHLAISGGNFSKPDQLARDLAAYYGLERIRYELI